jgi:hypothetical protein
VDSLVLPRCFAEVIDHITASDFARIELVVTNTLTGTAQHAPDRPDASALRRFVGLLGDRQRRRVALFSAYERWDRQHVDAERDPLAPVDCSERLAQVEAIAVTPITKGSVQRFPPDVIDRVRGKHLDVLIRFGFRILRGDILTVAKYGVWSYHHGDNEEYRGGPACFWEMVEGNPRSGVVLQVLTEELDAGRVLCRGLFGTAPGLSVARNQLQPFWAATTFVIQKLHEVHAVGWEHVERRTLPRAPYRGKRRVYRQPSNLDMVRWLGPALVRKAANRFRRRSGVHSWKLAVRVGAPLLVDRGTPANLDGFRWVESPRDRFYADPFLVEHEGKTWLYFEDADLASGLAVISVAEMRPDGTLSEPRRALERPYHLSYPHVFRDGRDLYMIPETKGNGAVELYRCERFPDRWGFERALFAGNVVDTTLWVEDGVYWFFTTFVEPRSAATQLLLFSADALTGAWHPHPDNPISTDASNSRGAGAIFRHRDGRLIRPSQDCSISYGRSFTLNEIVALDRRRYEERPAVTIRAPRGFTGTHTYAHAGRVEVVDGTLLVPPLTPAG